MQPAREREGAWGAITARWYRRANASLERPPGAGALARAWLGPASIRYVDPLRLDADAVLEPKPWGPCIEVRANLAAPVENYAIARVLAGWILSHETPPELPTDAFCRRLAAVLLVPKPALVGYWSAFGGSLEELAEAYVVPQALMALRLGECLMMPTALVWPDGRVERRGLGASFLPDEALFDVAQSAGTIPPLRRLALTDTPEIVAFQGDEGEGCDEQVCEPPESSGQNFSR